MKKTVLYRVFTLLFFAICITPTLGTLLLGPSEAVANETMVPPPRLQTLQGEINREYLSDAGDWFSKHFAFRRELITADSLWKARLLATSAQTQVALGRDGWLYYAETVDDYTGADNITPRQAFCCARSLKLVQDWVEEEGGTFVFTVAPNKLSLYPEHFSGHLQRADRTAADRLAEALAVEDVAYADLFTALSGAEETLYHRTDSHWTNKGAALGHDAILAALGMESAPAYEKPGHYESTHEGDLYVMLYPALQEKDKQFVFDSPLQFTYESNFRAPDDILIETAGQGTGTLLMFRDSFGNALHSLMAESFAGATFTRATPYDLTGAAEADYVVLEIVERNIPRLAQGDYLVPAPEMELTGDIPEYPAPAAVTSRPETNLPGYAFWTGSLSTSCDSDSPIYLAAGDTFFEAFPTAGDADGFTALIPDSAPLTAVIYWKDGEAVRVQVEAADSNPGSSPTA